jgi:hypothetical protein
MRLECFTKGGFMPRSEIGPIRIVPASANNTPGSGTAGSALLTSKRFFVVPEAF